MAERYMIGDLHLDHHNILKWRSNFRDEQDMFEHIKDNHHKVVTNRDVIVHMGDIAFSKKRLNDIKQWSASKKIIILGNHDFDKDVTINDICNVYDEVHGALKHKGFMYTHIPIHPSELRGNRNIHGHTHVNNVDDHRYFNTSCENINYTPISITNIRKEFLKMETKYLNRIQRNIKSFNYDSSLPYTSMTSSDIENVNKALKALNYNGEFTIRMHNGSGIGSNIIIYNNKNEAIADITDYNSW